MLLPLPAVILERGAITFKSSLLLIIIICAWCYLFGWTTFFPPVVRFLRVCFMHQNVLNHIFSLVRFYSRFTLCIRPSSHVRYRDTCSARYCYLDLWLLLSSASKFSLTLLWENKEKVGQESVTFHSEHSFSVYWKVLPSSMSGPLRRKHWRKKFRYF